MAEIKGYQPFIGHLTAQLGQSYQQRPGQVTPDRPMWHQRSRLSGIPTYAAANIGTTAGTDNPANQIILHDQGLTERFESLSRRGILWLPIVTLL